MTPTVQIDDLQLRNRLNQLAGFGLQTGRVLRVESRRLLQDIIKELPPKQRRQGESAIKLDLLKVFFPVDSHAITFARRAQKKAVADYVPLWTDAGRLFACTHANFKPDLDANGMAAIHRQKRNAIGRVSGGGRMFIKAGPKRTMVNRIVVKRTEFNRYAREAATHVGKLKAGFAIALTSVGGSQPEWVMRNAQPTEGFVVNDLQNGPSPSITVGNTSAGANRITASVVQKAVERRIKSIGENVKRMALHGPGASGDYGYGN